MPAPTDPNCIFCKIIAGAIPCFKLWESPTVLSFLDIGPLSRGHALVIPKGHAVTLDQLTEEVAGDCGRAVRKVGAAVAKVLGAAGWNVLQNNGSIAGQVVPHVHFHIIPRKEGDGLGYRWNAGQIDKQDAAELVKAIVAEI